MVYDIQGGGGGMEMKRRGRGQTLGGGEKKSGAEREKEGDRERRTEIQRETQREKQRQKKRQRGERCCCLSHCVYVLASSASSCTLYYREPLPYL